MERIPISPPVISPLDSVQYRPVWSVMIPVYNCSDYLVENLESVLRQDLGEELMQIEVVDDASTDADIENIVSDLGKGRIGYFRQAANVGSLRNFETCFKRSKGKFIHLLHGDDLVKPGFYDKITALFKDYPEAGAAFSNYDFINEFGVKTHTNQPEADQEGILSNWLTKIAGKQRIQYAAMVVKREVYETLGGFYGTSYGEDWEMWVRIAKSYPVAYSPKVLAQYRTHPQSISWNHSSFSQIHSDLIFVLDKIRIHLPEQDRKKVLKKSKFNSAKSLLGIVYRNLENRPPFPFIQAYMGKIVSMSIHPFILAHLVNIYYKMIKADASYKLQCMGRKLPEKIKTYFYYGQ
ncbi:glycosyltransferase family 2 protein [Cyclobacterium salsum]|uniref:glycosyltransferase family 2 protein n=1 Tax=Cyclobacterium salsum TaxID=2666329 RepID=UPI001391CA52|nr:glycosyltransferase [Cyclobacterium salsum]